MCDVHLGDVLHAIELQMFPETLFRSRTTALKRIVSANFGCHIVIPEADSWLGAVALAATARDLRGASMSLLVLRPRATGSGGWSLAKGVAKALLGSALASQPTVSVGALTASSSSLPPYWSRGVEPVVDVPLGAQGMSPSRATARSEWRLPADAIVLGTLGRVTTRKAPTLTALVAAEVAARTNRPTVFFLPGEVEPTSRDDVVAALTGSPVTLVVGGEYLSASRYATALRACDAVFVVHNNEGTSGVVAEARACGVPVVAAGALTVRQQVQQARAGIVAENLTVDAIARATITAVASDVKGQPSNVGEETTDRSRSVASFLAAAR